MSNDQVDLGDYSFSSKSCLGQGQFGKVYLGQEKKTGEEVAVKEVRKRGA